MPPTGGLEAQPAYSDVTRIRTLLRSSAFDAVVVAWPENVGYFSGFYHPDMRLNWERLHLVVWPAEGEPVFVVPHVRAHDWNGGVSPTFAPEETRPFVREVRGYSGERLEMVHVVASVLAERGLTGGLIGVEARSLPVKVTQELKRLHPSLRFGDAWHLLNAIRQVKTPAEVEVLRRANLLTARTLEAVLAEVRPGTPESEVAATLARALFAAGAQELSHSILGGGARGGGWHPWPTENALEEGMLIRADWGVRIDGYTSDIARTACVGTASPRQRDVHARIAEVHQLVVEAARPGVVPAELLSLARKGYERLGLEYRWGMVGHGIGRVIHEEPQLSDEYDDVIVEGMTLQIELGWVDQREGYHIEDLVHVGAEENVNLTAPDGGHTLIESGAG
jgi:Xaa-Pro aminopeptidase